MNNTNFNELKKSHVAFKNDKGETTITFFINKLPVIRAVEALELLRTSVAHQLENVKSSSVWYAALLSFPTDKLTQIQDILFESVSFTTPKEFKDKVPLLTFKESAYSNLDPFDVYDLTVRCLVVNFFCTSQKLTAFLKMLGLQNDLTELSK
jgi:hypothetical protein